MIRPFGNTAAANVNHGSYYFEWSGWPVINAANHFAKHLLIAVIACRWC